MEPAIKIAVLIIAVVVAIGAVVGSLMFAGKPPADTSGSVPPLPSPLPPSLPSPPPYTPSPPPPPPPSPPAPAPYKGTAGLCINRNVTRVIDGDTLEVEGGLRIRLVLVDAPGTYQTGGPQAKAYLVSLCSGARALIDEDDFQIGADPYGRVLAVVYCDGTNAKAAMIASGLATTYYRFCTSSEFEHEAWTGCP